MRYFKRLSIEHEHFTEGRIYHASGPYITDNDGDGYRVSTIEKLMTGPHRIWQECLEDGSPLVRSVGVCKDLYAPFEPNPLSPEHQTEVEQGLAWENEEAIKKIAALEAEVATFENKFVGVDFLRMYKL